MEGNQSNSPAAPDNATADISAGLAAKNPATPAAPAASAAPIASATPEAKAATDPANTPVGMVSLADVHRLIKEGVEKATSAQVANSDAMIKRHEFLTTTMKNFPSFVTKFAPMTGDEKTLQAWGAQVEKEYRESFFGELKKVGLLDAYYAKTNVGGNPGGHSPAEFINTGNAAASNPVDLISQGLAEKRR